MKVMVSFLTLLIRLLSLSRFSGLDIGEVYSMCLNEIYLSNPLEHIVLTLRKISQELPELPVAQIYTSHNYIVYVTGKICSP